MVFKTFRLIVPFLIVATTAVAQSDGNVAETMGIEFNLPGKHDNTGFVQLPSGEYLQLSQRNSESLAIQKLDATGKLLTTEINTLADNPSHCETQAVLTIGDKIWWRYLWGG